MNDQVIELLIEIRDLLKDKFEPVKINSPRTKKFVVPYEDIVALYHDILHESPRIESLTPKRKGYIKSLWIDDLPEMKNWANFFRYVAKSDFLMGKSPKIEGRTRFTPNLEWITKPENFLKILEKSYHG